MADIPDFTRDPSAQLSGVVELEAQHLRAAAVAYALNHPDLVGRLRELPEVTTVDRMPFLDAAEAAWVETMGL